MIVKLLSDLHLEFQNIAYVDGGEDVCILAGDIGTGMSGVTWAANNIPSHINVLYVPGNHEYYGHDYSDLNVKYKKFNKENTNVRVLLNDTVVFEEFGVEFVGTPLWTDFNLYGNGPTAANVWQVGLNDSKWMRDKGQLITADHFIEWNKAAISFLEGVVSRPTNNHRVLITHYCHQNSIDPRYKDDPLTPGFATVISNEIHAAFRVHCHGHTHTSFDYITDYGTRVICNPHGYSIENMREYRPDLVFYV